MTVPIGRYNDSQGSLNSGVHPGYEEIALGSPAGFQIIYQKPISVKFNGQTNALILAEAKQGRSRESCQHGSTHFKGSLLILSFEAGGILCAQGEALSDCLSVDRRRYED